jgi:hypothetical protein
MSITAQRFFYGLMVILCFLLSIIALIRQFVPSQGPLLGLLSILGFIGSVLIVTWIRIGPTVLDPTRSTQVHPDFRIVVRLMHVAQLFVLALLAYRYFDGTLNLDFIAAVILFTWGFLVELNW